MIDVFLITSSIMLNLIIIIVYINPSKLLNLSIAHKIERFFSKKHTLNNLYNFICTHKNKSAFSKYALTDFLDIFVLNLQAGLNTFKAFERASLTISDQYLQKNCKKILKKYYLGASFLEALQTSRELEKNTDLDEALESITLSLQLGTSLAENLSQLSNQLKAKASTELEKLASEASVKMIFPLVFFIFPVIFILLGSASIEDFIKSFNN